jgi:hypothetical protein
MSTTSVTKPHVDEAECSAACNTDVNRENEILDNLRGYQVGHKRTLKWAQTSTVQFGAL